MLTLNKSQHLMYTVRSTMLNVETYIILEIIIFMTISYYFLINYLSLNLSNTAFRTKDHIE